MRRATIGTTLGSGLLAGLSACAALGEVGARPPNVVLIYADDLGYGDLSCHGATKLSTPNIDRLAAEGRRFTDAHSASAVCTPSRYALLTGEYPFRRNLYSPVFHETGLVVEVDQLTIADVMKGAGYATACIGKWHLGFGEDAPDWNGELVPGPLELGFDHYFGVPVVNSHPPFVWVEDRRVLGLDPADPFVPGERAVTPEHDEKFGLDRIGGARAAHELYDDTRVATTLTERATGWLRARGDEPFFLYLATTNIHHPFTPRERFRGTSACGPYGDFVHELDWIVGEILETLDELGVAEDTLVLFTSDNGAMLNRGGQDAWRAGHRLNGELLGFKFDAWEGGHRVPFIVRWPGVVPAGTVSDQLVGQVDLLATLAALVGHEPGEGEGPDSVDLLPALLGDSPVPIREHLVAAAERASHLALREGRWVYISGRGGGGSMASRPGDHGLGGPGALLFTGDRNSDVEDGAFVPGAPGEQLYDLEADPSQTSNVVREFPEIASRMRRRLDEVRQRTR